MSMVKKATSKEDAVKLTAQVLRAWAARLEDGEDVQLHMIASVKGDPEFTSLLTPVRVSTLLQTVDAILKASGGLSPEEQINFALAVAQLELGFLKGDRGRK